jgi:hypothetical protein
MPACLLDTYLFCYGLSCCSMSHGAAFIIELRRHSPFREMSEKDMAILHFKK